MIFLVSVASLLEMANTIRFGTSCGPQATASAGRAGVVEEVVEEFGKDYLNPFVKMSSVYVIAKSRCMNFPF